MRTRRIGVARATARRVESRGPPLWQLLAAPGFAAALPSVSAPPPARWVRRVRLALRPLSAGPSGDRRPVRITLGSLPSRYGATRSRDAASARIKVQNNTWARNRLESRTSGGELRLAGR